MNCPICEKKLTAVVCDCGYDRSRDYENYPTFAPVPRGLESIAVLRDRLNNLVRCAGCGGHTFVLNRKDGNLACSGCGRALTAEELKPLTDALGMRKGTEAQEKQSNPFIVKQDSGNDQVQVEEILDEEQPVELVAIEAGKACSVAVWSDGTITVVGDWYQKPNIVTPNWQSPQKLITTLNNVAAVSAAKQSQSLAILKKDGTVLVTEENGTVGVGTEAWRDITAISKGRKHVVGLKKDGTVVAAGSNAFGQCDVSDWRDIIAISAGPNYTVGLTRNGFVKAVGYNFSGECNVDDWRDIIAISAGATHTVALKADGTVVAVGRSSMGECRVSNWRDIIAVSAGCEHTVGLKNDGTVVTTGSNLNRQCKVTYWRDISAISAGGFHTIGMQKDGTIVTNGETKNGQRDINKLVKK